MNVWAENPEWFDDWIFERALDGRFGEEIQRKAENDEIEPQDLWDLDKDGSLGSDAMTAYYERYMP